MGDILRLLFSGLTSLLTGKSKLEVLGDIYGGHFDKDSQSYKLLSNVPLSSNSGSTTGDVISSLVNKYTGAGLTGAEVAQNEWTAEREDTRYQRVVADMQSAGLNPALMYANGSSAPSVNSSAGGVAGSGSLSDFLQLLMMPLQMKAAKADIDKTKAETDNIKNEIQLKQQSYDFNSMYQPLLIEAREVGNELSRSERRKIEHETDLIVEQVNKTIAEAHTEEQRAVLLASQSILANAEANQIIALMPYKQALVEAQTNEARAAASLNALQAAYQQRILKSDYLDNLFKQMEASAKDSESRAAVSELQSRVRTGKLIDVNADSSLLAKIGAGCVNYPVAVIANVLDSASGVIAAALGAGAAVKVAGLKSASASSSTVRMLSGSELDNYNRLLIR